MKDEKTDAYIEKSADFAQPILIHFRDLVHKACPEVRETIKWGFPNFEHKGLLCGMAAFKKHCTFTFYKATLMQDPHSVFTQTGKTAMGHLGQIKSVSELPADDVLIEYLKEAVQLNEESIKAVQSNNLTKELEIPEYLIEALNANDEARRNFHSMSYSGQKEYIDWFNEAKKENTRNNRIATAIEWIKEGKGRNWKYKK